jgi:hypothetical protein
LPVLKPREVLRAHVRLKDGRNIDVDATIAQPRPSVALIDHSIEAAPASEASHIQLGERGELPQGAKLSFSVRARSPATFAHDEKIEVATVDEAFSTTLSVGAGITLEDRHVAVARFDPAAAFGPSAFGPLQFRVIEDGAAGDWQPLTTLVRLPVLKALECPSTPELACRLSGTDLFLVDAVSDDRRFSHPVRVPDGFPGRSLPVPHPIDGQLYLKLRDDPAVVHLATLVAQPRPASPEEAERAPERQASTTPAVAAADSLAPPTVTSAAAAAAPLPVVADADSAAAAPATPTDRSAAPPATTSPALPPAGAVPSAAAVQPSAAVQPAAVVIAPPTPSSKAPAVVTTVAAPVSATGPSPALSPAPLPAPVPAGQ